MSLQMETPRRPTRRRGSRTPFNPLKSAENSMDIGIYEPLIPTTCEELGIKIRSDNFEDFYAVEDNLGRGKFATVKRAVCKETGKTFAAKYQRKRRKAKCARHELMHEVRMLATCRIHPRIVSIREVFETRSEMIIVTDFAEGGELYRLMEEKDTGFCENEVRHLMRQTLEALAFLHDRSIVHMDIKPQNILLSHDSPTSDILLCDLGFSRDVTSGEEIREIIGTPDFVAPEILNYDPLSTGSDMWSSGVLAYMLLSGHSPFAGENKMETFSNIAQAQLEFPEEHFRSVSESARDFIRKLLIRQPSKRMTAHESLQHPWLEQDDELSQSEPSTSSSRDSLMSLSQSEHSISSDSLDKVDEEENSDKENCVDKNLVVTKSAISHISIELVKKELETLEECEQFEKCDSNVENCEKIKNDNDVVSKFSDKCEKDSNGNENVTAHNKNRKLSSDLSDSANQRKALKELSNQRTAAAMTSPLASPIGCRRALTPSPETILEIEPIKKHHCRRDSGEVKIILKTDLHVSKVESKVWEEVVFEDKSAVSVTREKEVLIGSS